MKRPRAAPDPYAALERAVAGFLAAAQVPPDPELAETPRRVAAAWRDEFLDGYRTSAEEALGEPVPAPKGGGLVVVTGIDYVGVCPHHLLPYEGVAHLAYRPARFVAGLGRLATLVDAYAHRLALQETTAREIAQALVRVLGAKWAGVVLEGRHGCVVLRGEKRARSRAVVEAQAGTDGGTAIERLWRAVGAGRRPRSRS